MNRLTGRAHRRIIRQRMSETCGTDVVSIYLQRTMHAEGTPEPQRLEFRNVMAVRVFVVTRPAVVYAMHVGRWP